MPLGRIREIHQELVSEGVEKITYLGGEPFLHPDLCDMAKHAKELGLQRAVVTNGTVLTEKLAARIVEEDLFDILIFSIDGPQAVHDRIRGREGIFKAATDNIRFIQKLRKSLHKQFPKIYLYTTVSSLNAETADQMLSVAQKLDAHELRFVSASYVSEEISNKTNILFGCEALSLHSYSAGPEIKIPEGQLISLRQRLEALQSHARKIGLRLSIEDYLTGNSSAGNCLFVGKDLVISFNGDISPCPMLPQYTLGNLMQKPLKEIMSSPETLTRVNTIMEHFASRSMPVCKECCVEKRE